MDEQVLAFATPIRKYVRHFFSGRALYSDGSEAEHVLRCVACAVESGVVAALKECLANERAVDERPSKPKLRLVDAHVRLDERFRYEGE